MRVVTAAVGQASGVSMIFEIALLLHVVFNKRELPDFPNECERGEIRRQPSGNNGD